MSLFDCVVMCLENKDLVKEYNRLWGASIGKQSTGIEKMIDDACGYHFNEKEMTEFIDFVVKYIWMPVAMEQSETGA